MSAPAKTYRVYCYDAANRTLSSDFIEMASDEEIIAHVEATGFGSMCEIWEGERLVARLEAKRASA
jgi:hypothetical protein